MTGRDLTLDDGTPAFAATPEGAARGAVVIHEMFGRQPEIDAVVERFARAGYAAVAPDLFSRGLKLLCINRALRDFARGEGPVIDQVLGARAWLVREAKLDEKRIG